HVGAQRNAVILALILHQSLGAIRQHGPARPVVDFGASHLIERLEQSALHEAGDQEAVKGGDVGTCAGGEVERQLLGELGVFTAKLVEVDIDVRIGGFEGGNDTVFDPLGGAAVDP